MQEEKPGQDLSHLDIRLGGDLVIVDRASARSDVTEVVQDDVGLAPGFGLRRARRRSCTLLPQGSETLLTRCVDRDR
jgi:hypothetical protein